MGRLRERVIAQFSGRGERAEVWRALDRVLPTEAFLNLGYSARYQPHALGSQRRLVTLVGRRLAARLPATDGARLLDVGCGRGGPAVHLAERFGFRVLGLDLVPYNLARAREHASAAGADAAFVRADAASLPVASGSLAAATAVDSAVYLPDRPAAFAAVADALEPGGVLVLTDLVARPDLDADARRAVARFADAWDMPFPATAVEHARALAGAGLRVRETEDLTPHSVGRFRTWTAPFCRLADGPAGWLLDRLLRRWGLDPDAVVEQVRRAHEALPHLGHALFAASRPTDGD